MTNLIRASDWEDRLSTYLDLVEEEPFQWGTHDCALFAASCIRAQTGVDPGEVFRGTYDSARGAAGALREHGAGTLLKTVKAWLGEPIPVAFAQRGDIMLRDASERDRSLGLCVGQYSYFVGEEQGRAGLAIFPTISCRHAFRVPFEGPANG